MLPHENAALVGRSTFEQVRPGPPFKIVGFQKSRTRSGNTQQVRFVEGVLYGFT